MSRREAQPVPRLSPANGWVRRMGLANLPWERASASQPSGMPLWTASPMGLHPIIARHQDTQIHQISLISTHALESDRRDLNPGPARHQLNDTAKLRLCFRLSPLLRGSEGGPHSTSWDRGEELVGQPRGWLDTGLAQRKLTLRKCSGHFQPWKGHGHGPSAEGRAPGPREHQVWLLVRKDSPAWRQDVAAAARVAPTLREPPGRATSKSKHDCQAPEAGSRRSPPRGLLGLPVCPLTVHPLKM